jgi:WD40 repeat protein
VDHRLVLAGYNDGDASDEPLLRLWDARTGKLVHTFPGYVGSVPYVAFTPDGKQVIGADVGDGSYRAWDTRTGKAVRRFEASPSSFPSAGLSSDGKFLLADMLDATRRGNQLRLWEVSTGKLLKTFGGVGASKLIFTPDGQQAVLASLRHPFLIDLGTGKVFAPPRLAKVRGEPLTFAPDGKWLLLDETEPGPRGPDALDNLTLWDLKADKPIRRLARTAGPSEKPFATTWHARAVAFAPGGKVAITADVDGMLRLWDLGEGKEAWSTTADGYAVAFSKGGQQVLCLASVRKPKVTEVSVQVRDAATGKLLRNVPCER